MATIHYQPDQVAVPADENATILDTSLQAGIPHTSVCGGKARCSTCRVLILNGLEHCSPRSKEEEALAGPLCFTDSIRLACQTTVSGDVTLRRLVLDEDDIELADQEHPDADLGSVGEEQYMAILFADLRGFTSFAEDQLSYDVIHILNRYFQQMGRAIGQHGGVINNYMGDGLLALFGIGDDEEPAVKAVRAGWDMLLAMQALNPYIENVYSHRFDIGIGIHYGQVVMGLVGASGHKRMTAIGDAVNLASRIEGANKDAGTNLLISEHTYEHVQQHVQIGQRITFAPSGKSGDYNLYEIVGLMP